MRQIKLNEGKFNLSHLVELVTELKLTHMKSVRTANAQSQLIIIISNSARIYYKALSKIG